MRVRSFVYDSRDPAAHVPAVLEAIEGRDAEVIDVGGADNPGDVRREAMLTVKGAVRIGSTPAELFDEDGNPDFSPGALVTEAPTGRRSLHVGEAALSALRDEE